MTDQETVMLIETEQRCKSNTHRIDNLENELNEEYSIESVEDEASEFEDEDNVAPLDPEDIFSEDDLLDSDL